MASHIDSDTSAKFANMSVICALMVCFIHTGLSRGDNLSLWGRWFHLIFTSGLCKVAVPYFFFAAGYFIAGHFNEEGWYARELSKRVRSLLVPLFCWCVIMMIWVVGYDLTSNVLQHRPPLHNVTLSTRVLLRVLSLDPFSQPYHGVLWFLRALFVLTLLSCVLKRVVGVVMVLALWIAYGFNYPDYGGDMSSWTFFFHEGPLSLFGATYYVLGLYVRKTEAVKKLNVGVGLLLFIFGAICLGARAMMIKYGCAYYRYAIWVGLPFLMLGGWTLVPERRFPDVFVKNVFPVYVLHMFVLSGLGRICRLFAIGLFPIVGVTSYLLVGSFVFVCSLFAACFIRYFFGAVALVLFGNRE